MPAILNLPQLTTSTGNIVFLVVDVNVTPNTTKKATLSQIKDYIGATVIAPQGYTGSSGVGYTGSQGAGYTGSQGIIGYIGSQGTGYTGSQGITGYVGSASTQIGYTGSLGYTGSAGVPVVIMGTTSTFAELPIPYFGDPGDIYITADDNFGNAWSGDSWYSLNSPIQGPIGYTGSVGYVGSAGAGYVGSAGIGYVGSAGIGYTGSQGLIDVPTTQPLVTLNTASSTSSFTGSIIAGGGVGVAEDLNVGGYVRADSQFILPVYTTSTLAALEIEALAVGGLVFLLNAPGGSQPVYYDGTGWFTLTGREQVV